MTEVTANLITAQKVNRMTYLDKELKQKQNFRYKKTVKHIYTTYLNETLQKIRDKTQI